jgi:hypothetical protein
MNPATVQASGMDPTLVFALVVAALIVGALICHVLLSGNGTPKSKAAPSRAGSAFADEIEEARKRAVLKQADKLLRSIGKRLAKPTTDLLPVAKAETAPNPAPAATKPA